MDKPYTTFTFGGMDGDILFSESGLSDVVVTTEADLEHSTYIIRAKCGPDTPISRVLDFMEAGMVFRVTLSNGERYQLKLEPADG